MANYVKDGEGRAGEGDVKRMTAKDMFEKEKRPAREENSSRERYVLNICERSSC